MDYYENWNTFISNIEILPEQLDGEKLIQMASGLKRTREEREVLGKKAAAGDKAAMECFINAYIPLIIGIMKRYAPRAGYSLNVLMNCVEKVREKVANSLCFDNLEYNISHYVCWMVRNEATLYIAERGEPPKECPVDETEREPRQESVEDMMEKINTFTSDEKQAEIISYVLQACRNQRERELIAFRIGLEDGVPKTLQETADRFGISRERARQIEGVLVRRIISHFRRRRRLVDYLDD